MHPPLPLLTIVDHLVYAAPDLDSAAGALAERLGVRASAGGSHPGWGTRNVLLRLGPASYLEIVAPDPAQPAPAGGRKFGIDRLIAPRLVTWAVKSTDIAARLVAAAAAGVAIGAAGQGARRREDGSVLRWRFTEPTMPEGDGLVPFFIDWGASPHPAASATAGVTLLSLHGEHSDPARVGAMLAALDVPLEVLRGSEVALVATLQTPRGVVELR